jgi:tungstate transport system ATP-binding protein
MKILELKNIIHEYNGREVLHIPNFSLEKGAIHGLVGPNGSGKSTLLLVMSLILKPTSGRVLFDGLPVRHGENSLVAAQRQMTMVLQTPYLFNTSVAKNVAYGLRSRGIPKRIRDARVSEALERVGLNGFEKRRARALSGGESQLVALVRALVLDPVILFLDEPTTNMDARHVHRFESLMTSINRERGTTVVMTSHDLAQVYRLTQNVFSLFEGSLVASTMQNLFSGRVLQTGQGPCFDTGAVRVWIVPKTEQAGATHISIDPESIIASGEPFASSARNQFHGKVTEVMEQGERILLKVRSSEIFSVQITDRSLRKMGLTVGSPVYLTFKASSVKLL